MHGGISLNPEAQFYSFLFQLLEEERERERVAEGEEKKEKGHREKSCF